MQTVDSKLSAERLARLVNVNNSVANSIKVRNEELKNMTSGIVNSEELELEILSPDNKMTNEITTSIVLGETDEAATESDAPLQKSSCPDSLMTVDGEESLLQKTSCQNRSITADLEVKILEDVIEEFIDESIEDLRGELVVKLQPRSTLELHWFRNESKENKDRRLEEFKLKRKDNKQCSNRDEVETTQEKSKKSKRSKKNEMEELERLES